MTHHKKILAGWLIDGQGKPVKKQQVLSIEDGVFASIGPLTGEPAGELVDLSHCTVVPPFIDAHLSLEITGSMDEEIRALQENCDRASLIPTIKDNIHHLFSHGVLAVRTGSDRNGNF